MIDLYSTPNGASPNIYKVLLLLEELNLPFRVIEIKVHQGEQFQPEFLKISPNNKVPVIVDHSPTGGGDPLSVFESGSILVYLADKVGLFIPDTTEPRKRSQVMNWVFWQMSGMGPYLGQLFHFNVYAKEKIPYAIKRYSNEVDRLFGVLERRLAESPWIGGEEYTIADMIIFASTHEYRHIAHLDHNRLSYFLAWHERIKQRPAYARAYNPDKNKASTIGADQFLEDKAWHILFDQDASYLENQGLKGTLRPKK